MNTPKNQNIINQPVDSESLVATDATTPQHQTASSEPSTTKRNKVGIPTFKPYNVVAEWSYYFTTTDPNQIRVTARRAVIEGYIYGLHINSVHTPIIFAAPCDIIKLGIDELSELAPQTTTDLAISVLSYLKREDTPQSLRELTMIFTHGFIMSYHKAQRYNYVHFYDPYTQQQHVLAELLMRGRKIYDTKRHQARIIVNYFGPSAQELRSALFEDARIDDNGNPVDAYGHIFIDVETKDPPKGAILTGAVTDDGQPIVEC